jgi:diguanylate cyclase (GGDEF)-like protein/hemerythrin-like metal-binding protein
MSEFKWDEGLSVGVDEIDNDHKMLLSIIAELSDAIEENHESDVIKDVFVKLESYVQLHFKREEALMRQCGYRELEAHISSHKQFVNKIPELRSELLNADTVEVARDVYLFLVDWLLNHIVVDDMEYFQDVYDQGLTSVKTPEKTWVEQFVARVGQRLALGQRIFLTALFPFVGLILLSLIILIGSFQDYQAMARLAAMSEVAHEINDLTHSLQAERGVSTGMIGSDYKVFSDELLVRRDKTDQALNAFHIRLKDLAVLTLPTNMKEEIKQSRELLEGLNGQRKRVDKKDNSVDEMQAYYTALIAQLLKIPTSMAFLEMDSNLAANISAFTALVDLKEIIGQERALGTLLLSANGPTEPRVRMFTSLIGQQQGLSQFFEQVATGRQKQRYQDLLNGIVIKQVEEYEGLVYESIDQGIAAEIDAKSWFAVLSHKIDQLKVLADYLVMDIEKAAIDKADALKFKLYLTAAVLIVIIFMTFATSWLLNFSIIYPVRKLKNAMSSLTKGRRDYVFTDKFVSDEIGLMVRAYESCRRSLLQADISSAVYRQRQAMDLQKNKHEHERYKHLASTDPLTGALNRRKFNKMAEHEIERIERFSRPLSVMMLDIDLFKKVNDNYGHHTGDMVLKEFYDACIFAVRRTDIVARLGGEEFAILMPETVLEEGLALAERVRNAIETLEIQVNDLTIKVTVSIGVTEWQAGKHHDFLDMQNGADKALYVAKKQGRNRVVTAC